jgi:hypothetical protein
MVAAVDVTDVATGAIVSLGSVGLARPAARAAGDR